MDVLTVELLNIDVLQRCRVKESFVHVEEKQLAIARSLCQVDLVLGTALEVSLDLQKTHLDESLNVFKHRRLLLRFLASNCLN